MTRLPEPAGASTRPWVWLSAILAAVAVLCLIAAVHAVGPREPRDAAIGSAPSDPSGPSPTVTTPAAVATPVAPPVRLRIPAIDVAARVTRLGLNSDKTVEVPINPVDTGWYRPGPAPGQPGSAVILGHVDSAEGPAVFHRLRHLEAGDRVLVEAADGSTSTFRVVRLATYPNEDFPADEVYAAPARRRVLNLVTCGGRYDAESGYQANVVVYTRWVHGA